MAVSCMPNLKNMQYNRYLMAKSPKFPRLIINHGQPSIDRSQITCEVTLISSDHNEQFGRCGLGYGADTSTTFHRTHF